DTLTGLAAMIWRQNNSSNYIRLDLRIGFDSLAGYLGGCAPSDSRRTRRTDVEDFIEAEEPQHES
ncbi:MAG: hypothetical protein NTZ90_18855, partial [Proteobacteria bacterium]|nr:hypothetical protein [Pseudomonadota bacterium]